MAAHLLAGALAVGSLGAQAYVHNELPHITPAEKDATLGVHSASANTQKTAPQLNVKNFLFTARSAKKFGLGSALKAAAASGASDEELRDVLYESKRELAGIGKPQVSRILENILTKSDIKAHIEAITLGIKTGDFELLEANRDLDEQDLKMISATRLTQNRGVKRKEGMIGFRKEQPEEEAYNYELPEDKTKRIRLEESKAKAQTPETTQKELDTPVGSPAHVPQDTGPASSSPHDPTVLQDASQSNNPTVNPLPPTEITRNGKVYKDLNRVVLAQYTEKGSLAFVGKDRADIDKQYDASSWRADSMDSNPERAHKQSKNVTIGELLRDPNVQPWVDFSQFAHDPNALVPDKPPRNVGQPILPGPLPENNAISNAPLVDTKLAPPVDFYRSFSNLAYDASLGVASAAATAYVASQTGGSGALLFGTALSSLIDQVNQNDPSRGYSEQVGSQLFYELQKGLLKGVTLPNPESEAPQILAPLLTQTEGTRTSVNVQDVFARGLVAQSGISQAQRSFQNWFKDSQTPYAVASNQFQDASAPFAVQRGIP